VHGVGVRYGPRPLRRARSGLLHAQQGAPVQRVEHAILNRPLSAPGGDRVAFIFEGPGTLRVLDVRRRSIRALANPASASAGRSRGLPTGAGLPTQPSPVSSSRWRLAVGARDVSAVSATASSPAWSPGGRRIALLRRRLWTVRPDGTGARRITSAVIRGLCLNDSTSAQSCGPRWSPDGRKLYYLAAR
jgi:WD40-like Beta Propeller Repeat